jgi:RNA polymerase sigma factor (sigma-70 family)
MDRATRGSERSAPAFVERFDDLYAVGYRAGYAVLGRRAEAEDCAQEAMARALARWSRVEDHAAAWVARVATNLALDRIRKLDRQRRHTVAPAPAVDDPVALRRHDLVLALRALPARQREAVVLRFIVDLSEHETARAMSCAVGTVKSSAARGLERLRATLGPSWALEES